MVKKYPEKRVKAYAFRQFQRTIEKEQLKSMPKSGKIKEQVIYGYGKVKEQIITYKTRKYSTVVYRDSKGRFTKRPESKIMPKGEKAQKKFFGESPYYRASVFIEVPYHSDASRGRSNYYWFGVIVIDKKEKIDIDAMREEAIRLIEKELHYNRNSLDWFDWEHQSIEYPSPYPSNRPDKFYEKWSRTHK